MDYNCPVIAACFFFTLFNVERWSANIRSLKKINILEYSFGEGEGVNKKSTLSTLS